MTDQLQTRAPEGAELHTALRYGIYCSRVSHCLLLVLVQNSDVKWEKKKRLLLRL